MSQKFCLNCQQTISSTAQFCPFCGQPQTLSFSASPLLTGHLPANALLDGRYVIDCLIGRGGMGAVYRAVDSRIAGRVCAIKEMSVMALPPQERDVAIQSFRQEAQLLANLHHPNLPKVHDFFQDGSSGRHYLVMDFVQGQTLEELLRQQGRPFSEQQVRSWAEQLCEVLHYLHSQNPPIIFRDLKPGNIMIGQNGQLKLIDFGIARFFQPAKLHDTQAFGTIGYAPPEQHGRGQTDARSDLYSLGATLWRLLTLQDPADDPYRLPGVRQYNPAVSTELEAVIQRTMQLRPEDRYPTVQAFREALQGKKAPLPASKRRVAWPMTLLLLLLLLLISGGGIVVLLWPDNRVSESVYTPRPTRTASPATITGWVEGETAVAEMIVVPTTTPPDPTTSPTSLPPTRTPLPPTPTFMPATPTSPPAATPTLPRSLVGLDGTSLILIPAGEFIMGSSSTDVDLAVALCRQSGNNCPRSYFTNEMPQRIVYLSDFYIDATEVTNDQYRACVNARICTPPSDSGAPDSRYRVNNYFNLPQYGSYPVVRIRWEDAQTYCEWMGRRLPTEAEWEKAARGTDGRLFPWGNEFDPDKANTEERGGDQLKPVGSYADGRSPYGVYDMAGNVWEYVADWYDENYYSIAPARDPQGPASGTVHVLRGGSYSDFKEYARVTNRGRPHADSIRSGFRGFRCAQSPP